MLGIPIFQMKIFIMKHKFKKKNMTVFPQWPTQTVELFIFKEEPWILLFKKINCIYRTCSW